MNDETNPPNPISHPSGHLYTTGKGPNFDSLKVPQSKSGKGCFFYGCLSLIVFSAVASIAAYFAFWSVLGGFVDDYSEETPLIAQTVEFEQSEQEEVAKRFKNFVESVQTNGNIKELILTSREINILFHSNPEWKSVEANVIFELDGSDVRGGISLPLESVGFDGRYMNGEATFDVGLANETLHLKIKKMIIKGEEVPEVVLGQLQELNLASGQITNDEIATTIRKLESLEVVDSKLVIRAK